MIRGFSFFRSVRNRAAFGDGTRPWRGMRGLAAVALAVLASPAAAQDPRELRIRHAVGDRRLVTIESAVDATLTTSDLDEKASTRTLSTFRKDSFVEEVLAVDDSQSPTRVRLNCLTSTIEERTAGETSGGARLTPLNGRILTVTREGNTVSASVIGGEPLPADQAAPLARWHDVRFLLKGPAAAVGDAWEVAAADRICSLVAPGAGSAGPRVRCTLREVVKGPPDRADVGVNILLDEGKEGGTRRLQGDLAGTLSLDPDAGKAIALTLSGTLNASQDCRDARGNAIGSVAVQAKKVEFRITFEPVP